VRYLVLIPEELSSWSCYSPVNQGLVFMPCGQCPVCKEVKDAGITHNVIDISSCGITKNAIQAYNIDCVNIRLAKELQ